MGTSVPAPSPAIVLKLEAIGDNSVQEIRMLLGLGRALGSPALNEHLRVPIRVPWVAEVTGLDARYGFARQFLRGEKDYLEANSVGSRGVYLYFHLVPGPIYEVRELRTWTRSRRYFCRVQDGHLVELTREEVEACLTPSSS